MRVPVALDELVALLEPVPVRVPVALGEPVALLEPVRVRVPVELPEAAAICDGDAAALGNGLLARYTASAAVSAASYTRKSRTTAQVGQETISPIVSSDVGGPPTNPDDSRHRSSPSR